MTPLFALLAVLFIKHFLGNYPLQNAMTAKALNPDPKSAWLVPMISRAGVHASLTMMIALCYWFFMEKNPNYGILACVVSVDFISHFLIDRLKVDERFLGRYKVASLAEMAQVEMDYKSGDEGVVAAARAKAKSNMYFWWGVGFVYMAYSMLTLFIASMVA